MFAIVLAGGFGTRLSNVVKDIPKPMAHVAGRPFLTWVMDQLILQGVQDVILSVHHLSHVIHDYFGTSYKTLRVHYALEETPLGTGGGILNALSLVPKDTSCFVLNGDSYLDVSFAQMVRLLPQNDLVLALRAVDNCARYGQALVDESHLKGFKYPGGEDPGWINGGVYLLRPAFFERMGMQGAFSFENDVLCHVGSKIRCAAFFCEGDFIDIGVPDAYAASHTFFEHLLGSTLSL
jgi:D-glycero-alpha-D-manno-heptose 1-phosphate guanylyltransferase